MRGADLGRVAVLATRSVAARAAALERRGHPGDSRRALEHYDHAARVEPGWHAAVQAHAARLRQDLAHAQGPRPASN